MIASWMVYCALSAAGLALAAVVAEHALLAGRGPVRQVWVIAIALSLLVPAVAFRFAPRSVAPTEPTTLIEESAAADSIASVLPSASVTSPSATRGVSPSARNWDWNGMARRLDDRLAILWLLASMALSGYFLAGMMALAWLRRTWEPHVVLGAPVLVSEHMGPALVAGLSPAIVVPRWALAMDTSRLALMLRHEQEHQRARDGQLLFAAQLALIAMPWNLALWWQVTRLRVAVELDCDARVLRETDARTYGDLLLEVVRPGRRSQFMVATAFAERATQLERRIRVMTRRRDQVSRGARVLAASIVLAAVTAAWISPRPAGPGLVAPARAASQSSAALVDTTSSAPPAAPTNDARAVRPPSVVPTRNAQPAQPAPSTNAPAPVVATVARDSAPAPVDTNPVVRGRGGRGGGRGGVLRDPADVAESIFARLFDGIVMTPDQASAARALLMQLARDERAQTDSLLPFMLEFTTRRLAIQARRDTALIAIPTTDADRETLKTRLAPAPGGGRRGGALPDSASSPQGVGRSGGRGGGRGVLPPGPLNFGAILPQMVDLTFHRLFDGVTLTPEQEAEARTILMTAQTEQNAVRPPPPRPAILREAPVGASGAVVLIREEGASSVLALANSDADRSKLESRMLVPGRPTSPPRAPQ